MTLRTLSRYWTLVVLACVLPLLAEAQISITALPYNPAVQNFNSYNSGTLPTGWTSAGTFRGAGTGSSTTGGLYAFGSSEFSAGALHSGTSGNLTYTVSFTNNSGGTINSITLAWDYEMWRQAGNGSGFVCSGTGVLAGNSVLATKGYAPTAASGATGSGTATPVSSFTLSGLTIANGQAFGISWVTNDLSGSDNGVSIDNFSISATGPVPALTAGTVSGFGSLAVGNSSTSQSFTLSGSNLSGAPGNITVTAPNTDFQVSNNNSTWGNSTTVAYATGTLASTNVWVRFTPQSTGLKTGEVAISGGGATASVAVSGTGTNSLTVSTPSLAFGNQNVGSQSASQSFTVTATGLLPSSSSLTVTAPTDFQVSNDNSTWGSSTTLAYMGGALSAVPVYVRFNPGSGGPKSGNVTLSGGSFSSPPSVAVNGTGVVVGAALLTSSIPSATFGNQIVGTNSTSQSFTISGSNLTGAPGNITLTSANADFQVSNNNSSWAGVTTVPFTSATLPNTTVYVRFTPQSNGARTGSIAITGGGASTVTVNLDGTGVQPQLSATTLEDFGDVCINTTGSTFSFALTGTNLSSADITVGPLDGFLFFDGSDFQPAITITQPGGTLSATDVFVRFMPTAEQSYSGDIPVIGGGTAIDVPVTGSGVNTPAEVGAGAASAITMHTAAVTASVITEGCSFVTGFGVEYSTADGFANGTGTQVVGNDLGGGSFSADLSGLEPCTTYYFKPFATSDGGTGYGPQGTFTTASIGASTTIAATGIFSTGFTANWQPVPEATGYLLDVSTQPTFAVESYATDLFISEYIEATSGNEKYIEVYNGTAVPVNMADYQLLRYSNGGTSPAIITMSGTLAVGAVAVYKHSSATAWPGTAAGTSGSLDFNGNDAVALKKISTGAFVDIIGRIGEDPGSAWTAGGNSTANMTLVRKNTVTHGVTVNPASGFPTLASEWTSLGGGNNVSQLGSHTSVVPSITPSFLPGYNSLPVSGTSQAVTGLTLGETYYYRVRAVLGSCTSGNSNTTSVTTVCDPVVLSTITTNAPICSLSELELSVNAVSGEGPINYQWTGTGGFAPDAQSASVLVTGSATGTYTVSASNSCSTAQANIDVTVEQATTWYLDADGDGLGDIDQPLQSCGQPEGFVATAGDGCPNDPNKTAPGVCGCGVADVATTWYADVDGDGFGDADSTQAGFTCIQPEGFVSNSDDLCPGDPNKMAPGVCGCGVADVTTTWYADVDGDGFGDPNSDEPGFTCDQPVGFVADNTDDCPSLSGRIGDSCNDGNPFTANDTINGSCVCMGTPVPSHNWTLRIVTDNAGNETTYEVRDVPTNFLLASGGPFPSNSVIDQLVSIPDIGNFTLKVFDSGNNGISNGGGYMLRDQNGNRVIDNLGNGAGFTSMSESPEGFFSPVGTDGLRIVDCDNVERWPFDMIVATPNPLVSAQWQVGNQTDDGYEFWFTNPNGGYSRHIFHSHATSGGYGPADANRACKLGLDSWAVNPLPQGVMLNVRIRGIVNSARMDFGPACRLKVDQAAANCHTTQLENLAGPYFSCGVSGLKTDGGSRIWAKPVTRYIRATNTYVNANKYKWHFTNVGESTSFDLFTPSYPMLIYPQYAFHLGATYDVTVQASFDNGATYCPVGNTCQISFAATNHRMEEVEATGASLPTGQAGDLLLWPNPNHGDQLYLRMDELESSNNEVSIDILDMYGKRVLSRTLSLQNGGLNTVLDLKGELASGLYLVNVTTGDHTITKRMVVQR